MLRIHKASQGKANILNACPHFVQRKYVCGQKKEIHRAVKVSILVTGCSGYTRQGKYHKFPHFVQRKYVCTKERNTQSINRMLRIIIQVKARQGNANFLNVLILYKENLCVGDNMIEKRIHKAVKVRMLVTGCSGYTQGKAKQNLKFPNFVQRNHKETNKQSSKSS
jgi:hypothetical protein